jgi:formiminotetrahydrofolate cyclodeaminase
MLSEQPFNQFLDVLAGPASAPGGGSAAAAAGAMGAGLVSMVCNLTIGKAKYVGVEPQMQEILKKSEALRRQLTRMIQEDVDAFENVMIAFKLPKTTDQEKVERSKAIQLGFKKAALAPMETAQACAEVITLAQTAAKLGNPNVASDGGVAVLCAQAGLKGAALNVLINLSAIKDTNFVEQYQTELNQVLARHNAPADELYETIKGSL